MRYLLLGEFRLDLAGAPPPALAIVPMPANEEQRTLLRHLLAGLRKGILPSTAPTLTV